MLFRFILFSTGLFSLKFIRHISTGIAALAWRFSKKNKHIACTNIRLCYPHLNLQQQQNLAREALNQNIASILELGAIWRRHGKNIHQIIQKVHGIDILQEALQDKKGVLLAAPHLGHWEVLGLYLGSYENFSLLYKPPKNKKIEDLIHYYRGQNGAEQITADAKGVKQILLSLKKGRLIGILPDQQPKNGQGVFSPFFAQSAYTMTLFSRIAKKTKVPVIMACAIRTENPSAFEIYFKRVSDEIYDETQTSVDCLNRHIQDMIQLAPPQYQWTYKRFSIQPDGATNPYRK